MSKEPHIFQKDGHGWYIENAGKLEGPWETSQDAQQYMELIRAVGAARTEVVCLDGECL